MDAKGFAQDLSRKAELLVALDSVDFDWSLVGKRPIVFLGMGSSHFATATMSTLLNRQVNNTVAVLASAAALPAMPDDTVVIAVSATGGSVETIAALRMVPEHVTTIALTNRPDSTIAGMCQHVIELHAGTELGEVASLTYAATVVALLRLAESRGALPALGEDLHRAAHAIDFIDHSKDMWLPLLEEAAVSAAGTYITAPLERLASAQQSALMFREGPRISAVATEVGDWSHIDVYLTKTLDYRLLLLPGSPWQDQLLEWTTKRKSTVIAIGHDVEAADISLRYPYDDVEVVRLLAEVTYAELLAGRLWLRQESTTT